MALMCNFTLSAYWEMHFSYIKLMVFFYTPSKGFQIARTNYFGTSNGLTVALAPSSEYMDTSYAEGVRMLINDGRDFPSDTSIEKLLPIGFETFTRVKGEETTSSGDVMALSQKDRNCVFGDERSLTNFPEYRDNNCDTECKILKISSKCDCTPFYYPNTEDNVCNFTKIPCLSESFDPFYETLSNSSSKSPCVCPSNCNNIYYEVRTNTVAMPKSNYRIDPF